MSGKKTIAENPQALIRYRILDRCLSNHVNRYYWEDLADAIEDYFGKRPSRRTVLNDLEALECDFGAMIDHVKDGRQVYYRYHNRAFSIFKNVERQFLFLAASKVFLNLNGWNLSSQVWKTSTTYILMVVM